MVIYREITRGEWGKKEQEERLDTGGDLQQSREGDRKWRNDTGRQN